MEEIRAVITGTLNNFKKLAGDEVEKGETIAEIESMKMLIPVEAPNTGKLVEWSVVEGEFVNENDSIGMLD
ncbi:biotin protein [Listeria floridensis FSL S10-1187]|uniref:Biotin protein n=1 Tax=Listeria floridensis FSL S10-1187 TaxID=1265817 RepID=A0ABN0RBR1_9LIST|nr:acetyl-CoA carboxylase biotin carboxyl carrier protein subunit [Listeria floridensis]EUJ25729.1 biotin protein [Listeria floridensis FSL S10-1187]